MNDAMLKPRKQEKMWMWYGIIVTVIAVMLILIKYVEANWVVITFGAIFLILLLWVLNREVPAWQYDDAIKACKSKEFQLTGSGLNDMADYCEVVPAVNYWYVHFREPWTVTFVVDPSQRAVIGRQIRAPDDIIDRQDKSEVLRKGMANAMAKRQLDRELSSMGYDVEEANDENTA